jgi:hypothetical protein
MSRMTTASKISADRQDGGIAINLQSDKDGQFFDLSQGWKFTNGQAGILQAGCALVLMPVRPGKLKHPQTARKASNHPKKLVK